MLELVTLGPSGWGYLKISAAGSWAQLDALVYRVAAGVELEISEENKKLRIENENLINEKNEKSPNLTKYLKT